MDMWVEEYTDVNIFVPLFATSSPNVTFNKGQELLDYYSGPIDMAYKILDGVPVIVNYGGDTYHITGDQNTGFALNLRFKNVTHHASGKYSVKFTIQTLLYPFLETTMDFDLHIWSKF